MVDEVHGYEVSVFFLAETTEGVTPTGSQTYKQLAHKTEVKITNAPGPVPVPISGGVDNASIEEGISKPVITLTITPDKTDGKSFMKDFASSDNSFTLLVAKKLTGSTVDTIYRIPGCKVKRSSGTVAIYPQHGTFQLTLEIWGWEIFFAVVSGTKTFNTPASTAINWSDIVVKKATVTVTDWWDFEYVIDNEIERIVNDQGATTALKRGRRVLTGAFTRTTKTSATGSTEFGEAKNATKFEVEFLYDGNSYKFNNSVLDEADVTHAITAMTGRRSAFIGTSLTIA